MMTAGWKGLASSFHYGVKISYTTSGRHQTPLNDPNYESQRAGPTTRASRSSLSNTSTLRTAPNLDTRRSGYQKDAKFESRSEATPLTHDT